MSKVKNKRLKPQKATLFFKDGEPHLLSPGKKEGDSLRVANENEPSIISAVENTCKKFGDKTLYQIRKCVKHHITHDLEKKKKIVTYEMGKPTYVTYKQYHTFVRSFSAGIKKMGVKPKDLVGICLDTSMEFILSAHATFLASASLVTMYTNLGRPGIQSILQETEMSTLITSVEMIDFFENLDAPKLKTLIVVGSITPEELGQKKSKYKLFRHYDVVTTGHSVLPDTKFTYPTKEDIAVVCYTSGTTGNPKGVMLTHDNFMNALVAVRNEIGATHNDRYISYLPMAHIFELAIHHVYFTAGSRIGFGNPRTLLCKVGGAKNLGDLEWIKPTYMVGVPRVWETIRKGILTKIKRTGGIKEKLFNWILSKKIANLKKGKNEDVFMENVVFKKVRQALGGCARQLISGGAPLSPDTQMFLSAVMGKETCVYQGLGLTENVATLSLQPPKYGFQGVGHVGVPFEICEIKLVDVPDMGYYAKDLVGEILVKSSSVMSGYYKREELNKKIFDKEGYFKTGDVGRIDKKTHFLKVIDRKKNLAKLENGKYVSLEKLETAYGNSSFVQPNGLCVFVDGLENHVVAIMLANLDYTKYWAKSNEISAPLKEIVKLPKFKKDVEKEFKQLAKKYDLSREEILSAQRFVIKPHEWTAENGCFTASFKLKRRNIKTRYENDIALMYKKKGAKKEIIEVKEKKEEKFPSFFGVLGPYY